MFLELIFNISFNFTKKYNELLELDFYNERKRNESLRKIFDRDFVNSAPVKFRSYIVDPTPKEGQHTIDVLFDHLTRKKYNLDNKKREYDRDRSVRLHWIKHHLLEKTPHKIDVFSVKDPKGIRTYIYDKTESYVIILEPKRTKQKQCYYLITAY